MTALFLGLEIGGTKLQLGLGPGDGALAALWRTTVEPARGADGIRAQILAAVPELLAQAAIGHDRIQGVGVGFGGPVDDATCSVIKSHQISGWDGFPLAAWLQDLLGLPTVLGNDADVAGLAEALFGAGKGLSPVFYITVGSGIGGGLIIDGEIYRGCGKGAAEIGHLRLENFPAQGIVEDHASGWAIAESAKRAQGDEQAITALHLAQAARAGDAFSLEILNDAWRVLALAITHVIALLCPRRIVIGGGVSLMEEEIFFKPLRALVAQQVFAPFANCYEIVPAVLGEAVVVHGALAFARKRLAER